MQFQNSFPKTAKNGKHGVRYSQRHVLVAFLKMRCVDSTALLPGRENINNITEGRPLEYACAELHRGLALQGMVLVVLLHAQSRQGKIMQRE